MDAAESDTEVDEENVGEMRRAGAKANPGQSKKAMRFKGLNTFNKFLVKYATTRGGVDTGTHFDNLSTAHVSEEMMEKFLGYLEVCFLIVGVFSFSSLALFCCTGQEFGIQHNSLVLWKC